MKQDFSMNKDITDSSYEFKYFSIWSGVCSGAFKELKEKKIFKVFFLALNYISKKYIVLT